MYCDCDSWSGINGLFWRFWNGDARTELVKEELLIISVLGFWFCPGFSDSTYDSNVIISF